MLLWRSWRSMASSFEMRMEQMLPVILQQLKDGGTVRFHPSGISMQPMLYQGRDEVVLAPLPEQVKKYDVILFRRDNGQFVLHRVVKAGESYTFCGDNQVKLEPGVRREQMIARVSAFYRRGRRIACSSFGYGLYCRLWVGIRPLRHVWRTFLWRIRRKNP